MSARLHQEYTAVVDRRMPWGTVVVTLDGVEILVDHTKADFAVLEPGTEVQVVVLDDARTPARGSLLGEDFDIARRLRDEAGS